jgi:hypothetical protein
MQRRAIGWLQNDADKWRISTRLSLILSVLAAIRRAQESCCASMKRAWQFRLLMANGYTDNLASEAATGANAYLLL